LTPYRLATFTLDGSDRPGLVVGDRVLDLVAATAAGHGGTAHGIPTDLRGVIEGWSPRVAGRLQAMADAGLADGPGVHALADVRLRAPIRYPWNLLCIAANYRAHADEMGRDSDVDPDNEEPVFFAKSPRNCIADPGEPFVMPAGRNIDWEGELGLVIGREAKDVPLASAMEHVFGYLVGFDVSDRGGAGRPTTRMFAPPYWFRGKSHDGAAPLGPWIVPAAHVPDPGALRITTRVNGVVKQDGSTSRLVWDLPHIIRSASAVMTLRPGDIILTGTPDGVGQGRKPPEFLNAGDVVEVEIEGIGAISTPMVAAPGA
jgi:2-keto-4-pentenoate hydratase/2-oxohepta-3-ene-1,7-dioic acid hydratase in catechol pathway